MEYLFVGLHPEASESGRPLVFGDVIELDSLEGADKVLADEGRLIPHEAPADAPAPVSKPASAPAAPAPEPAPKSAAPAQPSTPDSEEGAA